MTNTTNITVVLDREVKERAEKMFEEFGMSLSTAFNIFVRQSLRQRKIPFEIFDPFYSETNQVELIRRIEEIESGSAKLVTRDLIEDDNDFKFF